MNASTQSATLPEDTSIQGMEMGASAFITARAMTKNRYVISRMGTVFVR